MAATVEPLNLCVEDPAPTIAAVRVAGDLNRASAPRLARLVDSCLSRCVETGRTDLIVDLACVRNFGQGGLHVLRHAQITGADAGVVLHLTGLSDRVDLLPTWVDEIVARFDRFPTLEGAVSALTRIGHCEVNSAESTSSPTEAPATPLDPRAAAERIDH